MIPWRNGEQTSPGPAVRTPPQPRARERFPLSRIPEEIDREIAEEVHPLNLTTYSDAVPLQVDPARLTTSVSPRADWKETKPTNGINDRKFSRPGLFQPSTRN
jgi:hypothetical protein